MGTFLLGMFLTAGAVAAATWKLWKVGLLHFGRRSLVAPVQVHINHGSAPRGDEQPTATGSEPSRWN